MLNLFNAIKQAMENRPAGLYTSPSLGDKPDIKPKPLSTSLTDNPPSNESKSINFDFAGSMGEKKPVSTVQITHSKPKSAPQEFTHMTQTSPTKLPSVVKLSACRSTGVFDVNGSEYVNSEDVELLGKLGFILDVSEYSALEKTSEVYDQYSYIEKIAGIPKAVVKAIDKGEAFSGSFLESMGYSVPKGYEMKGDLCCPMDKKAEEPLAPNMFRLSDGTVIDLNNLSYTARGKIDDYITHTIPKHISGIKDINSLIGDFTNSGTDGSIKSPSYTFVDDAGKHLVGTYGTHRPLGFIDGMKRQLRHQFTHYSPEKIELPETFAKELYDHLGGDSFFKTIDHDFNNLVNKRLQEKGFGHNSSTEPQFNFGKENTNAMRDWFNNNARWKDEHTPFGEFIGHDKPIGGLPKPISAPPKPNFIQKIKPYNKAIGIGAGLTGLGALAYYLYNKNKEKSPMQPEINEKQSAEKPGLWANIRAKKARGEKPSKPGDEAYPDKKQWDKLSKQAVAAWQRSEGKNPEGGLNAKGRASYKRETGGTLKAPVGESNPKGERAKRQHSFCSRMCGMKRKNTGSEGQSNPDSRINKSLRKWNCKCGEDHSALYEKVACVVKEAKGRCWEGYKPVKGKKPYSEDSCEPIAKKIEKEAMTLSATKKMLRAFKNSGGKMTRELGGGSYGNNHIILPARKEKLGPIAALWHEYGHHMDPNVARPPTPKIRTNKDILAERVGDLPFENTANTNALKEMHRLGVPLELQKKYINIMTPAFNTYKSRSYIDGVNRKYLDNAGVRFAENFRENSPAYTAAIQQEEKVFAPIGNTVANAYLPELREGLILSDPFKDLHRPLIKNLRKNNPAYDKAFRQYHGEFKEPLSLPVAGVKQAADIPDWVRRAIQKNDTSTLSSAGSAGARARARNIATKKSKDELRRMLDMGAEAAPKVVHPPSAYSIQPPLPGI